MKTRKWLITALVASILVSVALVCLTFYQECIIRSETCRNNLLEIYIAVNVAGVHFYGVGADLPSSTNTSHVFFTKGTDPNSYCPSGVRYVIPKTGTARPTCSVHGDLLLDIGIDDEDLRCLLKSKSPEGRQRTQQSSGGDSSTRADAGLEPPQK